MHHCDTLAIKVSQVLRGTSERVAMQWIYTVESHLLGFVERSQGRANDNELAAVVRSQVQELLQSSATTLEPAKRPPASSTSGG